MLDETEALLRWYDANKRTMPWRGSRDPYAIWVSETMLQQTRVETVLRYYPRFLAAFPTIEALAAAPEEDVLKLWEGLGYYRRAKNLQLGARQVVEELGGVLPRDAAGLQRIHGIGPYTAGAIASIAFDQPVPAVDGNVIRVVSRLRAIREEVTIPSVRRVLEREAAALVHPLRPGDHNQAMMDLGATVCVPGTPDCAACPLCSFCRAYEEGDPEELPLLPRRTPPKEEQYDVLLLFAGQRVLMRRRTETMLQGLWVFPMAEGANTPAKLRAWVKRRLGMQAEGFTPLGEAKHVFTHRVWQMKLYSAGVPALPAPEGWRWISAEEMQTLALPTAVKKAKEEAMRLLEAKNPARGAGEA